MLHAWSDWNDNDQMEHLLQGARRALSLFQHHDGITGTARDHVVKDYAMKMSEALKSCKFVIQQAVYRYLTKPSVSFFDCSTIHNLFFFLIFYGNISNVDLFHRFISPITNLPILISMIRVRLD